MFKFILECELLKSHFLLQISFPDSWYTQKKLPLYKTKIIIKVFYIYTLKKTRLKII